MRHLLSINDLSASDAIGILDTATELARINDGQVKKLPTLRGRTIVNLFAEDSTRTRISFEAAAKRLSADVINFSAKGSSLSKGESLKDTAQTLQAMGVETPTLRAVSDAVCAIRQSKLPNPAEIGNAGSFFKNPEVPQAVLEKIQANYPTVPFYPLPNGQVKIPAGWLIEQAGWKGKRIGAIGVHAKQALVLVHYGGGKGQEIEALAREIQQDIAAKFGVSLQTEVNFI